MRLLFTTVVIMIAIYFTAAFIHIAARAGYRVWNWARGAKSARGAKRGHAI